MKLRRIDLGAAPAAERNRLVRRSAVPDPGVREAARRIVDEVRTGGDAALLEASRRFGGGRSGPLRVPAAEMAEAAATLDETTAAALAAAAANIRAFHGRQLPVDSVMEVIPGVTIARRWTPLGRIGAYVPGGQAAYPSSLLMTAVPARVAGVAEVVVACPAGADGRVAPVLLAAAALAGVDELYVMGGAQAVAALAYGTETIRPVQKIVGPGNAWVTAAKLAVLGDCAIDMPAGPSEALVVADRSADPRVVAADLLCQAEHGPDSPAVLVTTDSDLADRTEEAIAALLPYLERKTTLEKSLAAHGLVILVGDVAAAIDFANDYAPEHLTVHTQDAAADAALLTAAGSVFVGHWSPESAGDYATGANHVLPTGGTARAADPLGVEDFGSWRQVQEVTREGLTALRPTISALAAAEGLTAHRLAAEIRFEEQA